MDNQNQVIVQSPPAGGRKWSFGPKIIFGLIAVILIVEAVYAFRTFTKPLPSPLPRIQPISGGKIVLLSPKKEYKVGETVPVAVRVVTGGHQSDGTDAVIKFDPKILEATGSANLKKGSIYPEYPLLSVDPAGLVRISGIASIGKDPFNGIGVLATVSFKAKASGKSAVTLDFTSGATDDSNIVESGTSNDLLEEVFNLELVIR